MLYRWEIGYIDQVLHGNFYMMQEGVVLQELEIVQRVGARTLHINMLWKSGDV